MIAYAFKAALFCEDCGEKIIRNLRCEEVTDNGDSDTFPQACPNGGGEADSPQHCDYCGLFLENMLTADGDNYLRGQAVMLEYKSDMSWDEIANVAADSGNHVMAEWIRFYYAWGQ
jgi:hypothetical protein